MVPLVVIGPKDEHPDASGLINKNKFWEMAKQINLLIKEGY